MRRTATTLVDVIRLAVLGTTSVLLLAPTVSAEQHSGGAGQTMMATINPVATGEDRVGKISYGTVKFTQGKGKVDVLIQAAGIPLGGREAELSSDGGPATVGFNVRIVKSADCATARHDETVLAELPQLRVKDDGSGIMMGSTDKVTLQQIAGQAVVISAPKNTARIGCGVIKSE